LDRAESARNEDRLEERMKGLEEDGARKDNYSVQLNKGIGKGEQIC